MKEDLSMTKRDVWSFTQEEENNVVFWSRHDCEKKISSSSADKEDEQRLISRICDDLE